MLKKNTTQTVIVENTFTVTGTNEAQLATALVRKVNNETPMVALSLTVPGRKRGVDLQLDVSEIKDLAALFAALSDEVEA